MRDKLIFLILGVLIISQVQAVVIGGYETEKRLGLYSPIEKQDYQINFKDIISLIMIILFVYLIIYLDKWIYKSNIKKFKKGEEVK